MPSGPTTKSGWAPVVVTVLTPPPEVIEVVRWHHRPEEFPGDRAVVDLVHAADALASVVGIGGGADGLNYRPARSALAPLGLSPSEHERLVLEILDEVERIHGRLGAA